MWRRIFRGIGVALVVALFAIGFSIYRTVKYRIPEAYAIWGTGELLVNHAERNDRLPESWNDLSIAWKDGVAMHAIGVVSFEELQELVEIDFNRIDELRESYADRSSIPQVVRTSSGRPSRWGDSDANWMLNEFFNKVRNADQR